VDCNACDLDRCLEMRGVLLPVLREVFRAGICEPDVRCGDFSRPVVSGAGSFACAARSATTTSGENFVALPTAFCAARGFCREQAGDFEYRFDVRYGGQAYQFRRFRPRPSPGLVTAFNQANELAMAMPIRMNGPVRDVNVALSRNRISQRLHTSTSRRRAVGRTHPPVRTKKKMRSRWPRCAGLAFEKGKPARGHQFRRPRSSWKTAPQRWFRPEDGRWTPTARFVYQFRKKNRERAPV